jgi:hypothetical protein
MKTSGKDSEYFWVSGRPTTVKESWALVIDEQLKRKHVVSVGMLEQDM